MNENIETKHIPYEEARKDKSDEDARPVKDQDVEASVDRINPDDESMNSRG